MSFETTVISLCCRMFDCLRDESAHVRSKKWQWGERNGGNDAIDGWKIDIDIRDCVDCLCLTKSKDIRQIVQSQIKL